MRDLLGANPDLTDTDLRAIYDASEPDQTILRLNMVGTVDGSATGKDGLSGSINTDADHVIFDLLRAWADVVLVGSGTVRAEKYDAPETAQRWSQMRDGRAQHADLAVLTSQSALPPSVTVTDRAFTIAPKGDGGLASVVQQLHERGYRRILAEGGPTVSAELLAAGLVDELCTSTAPVTVAGDGKRIVNGDCSRRELALLSLVEEDGTLMARWAPA